MSGRLIYTSIFCFIIIIGSSFIDGGILFWNKNFRLGFDNFKAVPTVNDTSMIRTGKIYSAHRLGVISKSIDVKLINKGGKTTFTIYAGMNQNQSWIRNTGDTVTLKHEQGHFDICEIYARMLRKEIKNAKSLTEAKEIFDKISDDENIEQDAFDNENSFQLGGVTAKWQKFIKEKLIALDAYQNPIIILPIYK
jgi:hypothetical protein